MLSTIACAWNWLEQPLLTTSEAATRDMGNLDKLQGKRNGPGVPHFVGSMVVELEFCIYGYVHFENHKRN
jgi:hypothetical protein